MLLYNSINGSERKQKINQYLFVPLQFNVFSYYTDADDKLSSKHHRYEKMAPKDLLVAFDRPLCTFFKDAKVLNILI